MRHIALPILQPYKQFQGKKVQSINLFYLLGLILLLPLSIYFKHSLNISFKEAEKKADHVVGNLLVIIIVIATIIVTILYT